MGDTREEMEVMGGMESRRNSVTASVSGEEAAAAARAWNLRRRAVRAARSLLSLKAVLRPLCLGWVDRCEGVQLGSAVADQG